MLDGNRRDLARHARTAVVRLAEEGRHNGYGVAILEQLGSHLLQPDHIVAVGGVDLCEPLDEAPTRRRQMLSGVDSLSFRFLDNSGEWKGSWPPTDVETPGLPLAIEFTLELEDYGDVIRVFALPG